MRRSDERIKRVVREDARAGLKRKVDGDAADWDVNMKREKVEESDADEGPIMDARKGST